MRVQLLWWLALSTTLLSLTRKLYSVEFTASSSPLVLTSADDMLYQIAYDESYGLLLWVRWGVPPSASSRVVQITNGAQLLLSITQGSDGRWTSTSGLVTIFSPALSTSVWTHVSVSVCFATGVFALYVTQWQGSTASYSALATTFQSLDPGHTAITLGTSFVGQILDCMLAISCLSLSDISVIVSSATCHSQCPGNCFGPGDRSCNTYIQLTDETLPLTMTGNYLMWTRDDPHFQGRSFTSTVYSFSGWYYQTSYPTWVNFFRSRNIPGNYGTPGQRIMALFQKSNPFMDINVEFTTYPAVVVIPNLPVIATSDLHP